MPEKKRKYHGDANTHNKTKEYRCWQNIKSRCNNPGVPGYENYGGRGIKICHEWENDFRVFLSDMGRCPDGDFSIDRINNDGDYEKSNCKWSSRKEQIRNRRRTKYVVYHGETYSLFDLCETLGKDYKRVYRRIHTEKWPIDSAIDEDVYPKFRTARYKNNCCFGF